MIRFTIRLVVRSFAWLAPTLVYLTWVAVTIGGGASALSNATGLFYASLVWSIWMTITTGNLDSDEHRELLAAASGSTMRLHAQRALSVLTIAVPLAAVASTLATAAGISNNAGRDWLICFLTAIGGGLLGTSFGTLLHRPLLRHRGLTVLLATLFVVTMIVAPPTLWALDAAESGDTLFAVATVAVLGLWCAATVATASRWAASRAR